MVTSVQLFELYHTVSWLHFVQSKAWMGYGTYIIDIFAVADPGHLVRGGDFLGG